MHLVEPVEGRKTHQE